MELLQIALKLNNNKQSFPWETLFNLLYNRKKLSHYLNGHQGFNCLKKSLPLSSTRINAGKSST